MSKPNENAEQLVLITGGAGFIGGHLVQVLRRGRCGIRVLDNLSPQIHGPAPVVPDWLNGRAVEFIRGSVTAEADVRMAIDGVDAIVHLAAETGTGQSMYEIARYNDVNVQGTAILLDALANSKSRTVKRLVLASSRAVYGEGAYVCETCSPPRRQYPDARSLAQLAKHIWEPRCDVCGAALVAVATREDDEVKPASIYAATKLAQEHLVRIACESLGIGYTILRLQNVFGEGQSLANPYTGLLSVFSTRVRRGLFLPLFEDGLETRDFIHVEDVAKVFHAALRSATPANSVINVGSGSKITIATVAGELSVAFGKEPDLVVTGQYRLGDIRHNCADISRLRDTFGYEPRVKLTEGLARFADWVKTQPLPEDRLEMANAELRARKLMGEGSG